MRNRREKRLENHDPAIGLNYRTHTEEEREKRMERRRLIIDSGPGITIDP